jgi:hypothetical protein
MKRLQKHFRKLKTASIILLFFTGVNAIIAGILFMIDTTGSKMGMSTSYLSNAPFANFLIPGITLFVVNGLMNVLTAILTLRNYKHFPNLIILQGLLLYGWIIMQVFWVRDFNGLHFTMLFIGVVLIILGFLLKKAHLK